MCIQNIMYANKIIDTFTFFTIEEHMKKLQAGLLTIESSYLLRLPTRLRRIVVYGLTTKLRDVQFSSSITAAGPFPHLDGIPFSNSTLKMESTCNCINN